MSNPWKSDIFRENSPILQQKMTPGTMRTWCHSKKMITDVGLATLASIGDPNVHNERLLGMVTCGNAQSFHYFCEILRTKESPYTFDDVLKEFSKIDTVGSGAVPSEREPEQEQERQPQPQPQQEPEPVNVPINGNRKLCDVIDLEELADDIKPYLSDDQREKFFKKVAIQHDVNMAGTYRNIIRDHVRVNDGIIPGDANAKNMHGALHWAHSRVPCPTINQIYACLTERTVAPQSGGDFQRILSNSKLCQT